MGREREIATLEAALDERRAVVIVHGVAGVGKTTILREFESRCRGRGLPTWRLDARDLPPTPDGFLAVVSAVAAGVPDEQPGALLLDNYETLDALDRWVREVFIPSLPPSRFVVIAGRRAPSAGWRSDLAWGDLFRGLSVQNLDRETSTDYLRRREVPDEHIDAVLEFTGGHPLALSLVAEVCTAAGASAAPDFWSMDVISSLVERFIETVPDDDHRRALELSALARSSTEELISRAVSESRAFELFRWLQGLSFMERGPFGIRPHELARTAIVADLKWRNPGRYNSIRGAVRGYYRDSLAKVAGDAQAALLLDYIYLHRENPVIAHTFQFEAETAGYADAMHPVDVDALVAMVERHEGPLNAEAAAVWLQAQPENVVVVRGLKSDGNAACGFLLLLALEGLSDEDRHADPAVGRLLGYVESNGPLRAGERATLFRFWMDADGYQAPSPSQSLIFLQMVRHMLTTPRLAFTFIPCRDPDVWSPIFSYAGLNRAPGADYRVGDAEFGVFAHDWRVLPPLRWLEMLAERESLPEGGAAPMPAADLRIFGREEFVAGVQDALRDWLSPTKLVGHPLLASRMVADRRAASGTESVRALQELLKEAALSLRTDADEQKLLRALRACYFEPCPSQDAAAERLQIGVATLRRHLKEAIARVVEYLWAKETA